MLPKEYTVEYIYPNYTNYEQNFENTQNKILEVDNYSICNREKMSISNNKH